MIPKAHRKRVVHSEVIKWHGVSKATFRLTLECGHAVERRMPTQPLSTGCEYCFKEVMSMPYQDIYGGIVSASAEKILDSVKTQEPG